MNPAHKEERPFISLCMNVKDEEENLPRCLDAVKAAVDEIIIVDTGSSDRSVEIAKSFGAKVYHHPWTNDFSEARNHTFQYAQGDWILWLDADEVLQPEGSKLIREAVSKKDHAGYFLSFTNIFENNQSRQFLLPRLYVNHPKVRWVNSIHSQIHGPLHTFANQNNLKIGNCSAKVFHYGYLPDQMEKKKKRERTKILYQTHFSKYPKDPYILYKYGDFIRVENREEAIQSLEESLSLLNSLPAKLKSQAIYGAEVLALLAMLYQESGSMDKAKDRIQLQEPMGLQKTPNFLFAKASVNFFTGDIENAALGFEACTKLKGQSFPVTVQWGVTGPLAHFGLAKCFVAQKKNSEAQEQFEHAWKEAPHHLAITLSYSNFLLEEQRPFEAAEKLINYLKHQNEPDPHWAQVGMPILKQALSSLSESEKKPLLDAVGGTL